jgi:hypothetical protein
MNAAPRHAGAMSGMREPSAGLRADKTGHVSEDHNVQQLDYAGPTPKQKADPRRSFLLLTPAAIFFAVLLGWKMYEDGDSRNFNGFFCMLVMAPLGLICGIKALAEARHPQGLRALAHGLLWSLILIAGLCGSLWLIMRFNLFR